MDAEAARVRDDGDLGRAVERFAVQRDGDGARIAGVGAGQRLVGEPEVGDRTGQRAVGDQDLGGRAGVVRAEEALVGGEAAGGRLERGDAAEGRRDPGRAAGVVAEPERGQAGGDRDAVPAAGAAGGAGRVPGVAGVSVQLAAGVHPGQDQGRHVAVADRDRPGGAQPGHRDGVGGGDVVAETRGAEGGGHALDGRALLHGEGHARERAEFLACGPAAVGVPGGGAGAVGEELGDGVEVRVDLGDAGEVAVDHVEGGGVAVADGGGEFGGGFAPQGHGGGPPRAWGLGSRAGASVPMRLHRKQTLAGNRYACIGILGRGGRACRNRWTTTAGADRSPRPSACSWTNTGWGPSPCGTSPPAPRSPWGPSSAASAPRRRCCGSRSHTSASASPHGCGAG